jgi:hypothetical protein
MTANVESIV